MATARTGPAGLPWRHRQHLAASPQLLVFQLPAKLGPDGSRIDLFRPDLVFTFFPSASLLPAADLDIFRTCKSSIHTIAWFWLIVVEHLCRKSRRTLAMRVWSFCTLVFAFFQLLLNFVLRDMAR